MELDDWLSQIVANKENILLLRETLDTLYKFTNKDLFHLDVHPIVNTSVPVFDCSR